MRLILLIDMDYFFVACEELRNKEARLRPTIVGTGSAEGRGVVMTCNYEARKYGIHSGMPLSQAKNLKKDALFLPEDFEYYEAESKKVMALIREVSEKMEEVSIDEAFVDISKKASSYDEAFDIAKALKKKIKERLGLPCSVGISTNKLMAKMACEKAKPDGIKVVKTEETKDFLKNMPVGKLYGVGRKTKERLEKIGYDTVEKLANANPMLLRDELGSFGIELINSANGIDESEVIENSEIKSIGRERTFERDTSDKDEINVAIRKLSEEVYSELSRMGFSFKTVTIKIRYPDFSERLKGKSVRQTKNFEEIVSIAEKLFEENTEKGRKVRKIGVRVSGLLKQKGQKSIAEFS